MFLGIKYSQTFNLFLHDIMMTASCTIDYDKLIRLLINIYTLYKDNIDTLRESGAFQSGVKQREAQPYIEV